MTIESTSRGAPRIRLLAILGVGFGLAVIVGNTIGAGILRSPGEIATRLPSFPLYIGVWIAGAVYAALGANALAELGTLIPRSGGQFVFARRGLGEYAGFVVGWSDWISTCGSTTTAAIVIAESFVFLFRLSDVYVRVISVAAILVVTMVQWRGMSLASSVQTATSVLKALALGILVAICLASGNLIPWRETATAHGALSLLQWATAIILSLQAVIFTYDGWSGVIYFSEEVKDPGRDIPRSMFGGLASVTVIYLFVQIALLRVVSLKEIAGHDLAAGVAAERIFGAWGDRLIRIIIIVTLLSAINAFQLMATRVSFGLGRDGLFTKSLVRVNRGGTPTMAHFASAAVAIVLATGTFNRVVALLAFFFVANYTVSFLSLFVLRRKMAGESRPYKAWGHPFTTGLALFGSLAFLAGCVATDVQNSIGALALLAVSYPAYRLVRRNTEENRPL
ncbi:MAG TPA: APC family permease [Thermoanaerobaculia bacterium]|nr:APC family permease [Thermoanaerobaculia bacterium]